MDVNGSVQVVVTIGLKKKKRGLSPLLISTPQLHRRFLRHPRLLLATPLKDATAQVREDHLLAEVERYGKLVDAHKDRALLTGHVDLCLGVNLRARAKSVACYFYFWMLFSFNPSST